MQPLRHALRLISLRPLRVVVLIETMKLTSVLPAHAGTV
jgi:hypothetical protein